MYKVCIHAARYGLDSVDSLSELGVRISTADRLAEVLKSWRSEHAPSPSELSEGDRSDHWRIFILYAFTLGRTLLVPSSYYLLPISDEALFWAVTASLEVPQPHLVRCFCHCHWYSRTPLGALHILSSEVPGHRGEKQLDSVFYRNTNLQRSWTEVKEVKFNRIRHRGTLQ